MILQKLHSSFKKCNLRFQPLSDKKGFTLVEMMVTIAIIGVLAAIAIGSLNNLLPRYRVKSAARQLRADLQNAKLEAVKQNETVLVDFNVGNPGSCLTCFDTNSDNDCDDEAAADVITRLNLSDYSNAELQSASFSGGVPRFDFNSRGIPRQGAGFASGTSVINCTKDAAYSLSIVINAGGRIEIN